MEARYAARKRQLLDACQVAPAIFAQTIPRLDSRNHRRQQGDEELLAVLRSRAREQDKIVKVDDDLSNGDAATPLGELARVAKAAPRMDACLQRGTSAAG